MNDELNNTQDSSLLSDLYSPDSEAYNVSSEEEKNFGKKIKPVLKPKLELGIDTDNAFINQVAEYGMSSKLDLSSIESFNQSAQSREQIYQLLDTMAEDPVIAAALEIYAEDATEPNASGQIMWAESSDESVAKYITFLLDSINIEKNIYKWANCLIKYGDVYLRLYRQSDFNDGLFDKEKDKKPSLNEDIVLKKYAKSDKYAHYLEMVPNPCEMFELTKFGKSYAYIQAKVNATQIRNDSPLTQSAFRYNFNRRDIDIYEATEFVHASLEDGFERVPEEVNIFINNDMESGSAQNLSYRVRRGQSILYNSFKIWREMMLLENALLLNRITKSSMIRAIAVEVGDMPKESVGPYLMRIKEMFEQRTALNQDNGISEYTNPGPVENNIYIPTRNQQGSISIEQLGGDANVKGLDDVDFFTSKLFSSLRIPKQFLGFTDDATGFNGGTSLSLVSSRYAKTVKRIQNILIQAITDAINLMLLDKGMVSYINKFKLCMQEPSTQESKDRADSLNTELNRMRDTLSLLCGDVEDPVIKLKMLKILAVDFVNKPEVFELIQEEIDRITEETAKEKAEEEAESMANGLADFDSFDGGGLGNETMDRGFSPEPIGNLGDFEDQAGIGEDNTPDVSAKSELPSLPSPADLGQDFTDNTAEL